MRTRFWLIAVLILCLLAAGCHQTETPSATEGLSPEIHTAQQLRQAVENAKPGETYTLMADIDLGGEVWQPVCFKGNLKGNGKTVSNMTIREAVDGNTGFFASLEGRVEDLHLENVTVITQAEHTGLLAGTNRGVIQNCTVTGSVTDTRLESCVGVMVGWNDGGQVQRGTDLLTATAGSPNPRDKAQGLSGRVAFHFPEGRDRAVGIVGKTDPALVDTAMCWQDTTGSFAALPENQQQRRQAVVDMMYRMGTVRWTPSEELRYTANDNRKSVHSNVFLPGRTYIGIPYNGCEGAYERFMTQMQAGTDSDGRYVTVTGLEDGVKTKDGAVSGFILNMGNDCVGAVTWALAAGVPYCVEDGGMEFTNPVYMVPNTYNTENFGALPVGDYGVIPSNREDGLDARDTKTIIDLNGGAEAFAEYYAKAYRGDYLICIRYAHDPATDTWKKTANHGRVLGYEPMIVRAWDGVIDLDESYVITHEQGDGLYDNRLEDGQYETYEGYNLKQTSWRTDYRYSLGLLLTESGYNNAYLPGSGFGYVPVTIAAYGMEEELAAFTCREVTPVELPNSGTYEANYLMTSATMTLTDPQGNTVYEKTAFLPYRVFTDFKYLKLEELFPDASESLTPGQTYYETLTVSGTGGRTCTVLEKEPFAY